jgi:hypothetical protein
MIDVMFLDEKTARETAEVIIEALGEKDPFAQKWIDSLRRRFGLHYRDKEYRDQYKGKMSMWTHPC